MKKSLHMQKGVFALLLALFLGMGTAYAYDFSATYSGKTFYFNITNSSQHYVEITYPGTSTSNPWGGYTKPTGTITLPSSITHSGVSYTVTAIGDYAFYACTGLSGTLTIPNTVMYIWNNAFSGCGFTGSLSIPNTVEIIGDNAFSGCTGFTSLSIGTGVEIIGTGAFYMCTGFRGDLTIPNTQQIQINGMAFYGCGFNGKLTIGTNTFSLAANSFGNCTGFTEIRYNAVNCHDVTETMKPFEGCTGTLVIGSGVQKIPAYMFNGCSGFTGTLTIPTSVTSIGVGAFKDCTGFTQVNYKAINCADVSSSAEPFKNVHSTLTIGSSVQRIPANMFRDCNMTGSLTIPSSVTSIGNGAFYTCVLFSSLTIGSSVTTIGQNAFGYCISLSGNLNIPNSVTTIGQSAFYSCQGFTGTLTIGTGVTTIGGSAFVGTGFTQVNYNAIFCADVTDNASPFVGIPGTLTIGSTVQRIPRDMFRNCSDFTGSLTIPNSVTEISYHAFDGCDGFNGTLTIGTGLTTIRISAFKNCTGFTQVNYKATNCGDVDESLKPFEGCTGTLTIGSNVQRIPAYMFNGCSGFTGTLTIPASVTSIGEGAFKDCDHISHLNFNATNIADSSLGYKPFENIGAMLVGGCSLTIGNSVQRIPAYLFGNTYSISGPLTIPNSVNYIGMSAFENCYNLTGSLTIPNSVTTIGTDTFYGCYGFTGTLTLGNSLTTIGEEAFEDCSGFTGSLVIPNSVTQITNAAFRGCEGFNGTLTLSNSLVAIEEYTFDGCSGFTGSLTIPNSVTIIGNDAFNGCSGFSGALTIGNAVTSIGFEAFHNCSGFTGSLTIPNAVTYIDMYAFSGCSGFTGSLTIGNSVTTIGQRAFLNCTGFSGSLTIGSSVGNIGLSAFENCSGFNSMTVLPVTPPTLGYSPFTNVPTTIPVYVFCPSLEDYQTASGWSNFTNMQCIQEPLTVYDGTTTNNFVPVYGYWADAYLKAEFVMPASALADMANGTINSMKFYATQTNVSWGNANFKVFLTEVANPTISAFAGPGTVVYQGALSIVDGEMTVNFTTPYQYNGGHLLVGIYNTVKGSYAASTWYGESVTGASVQGYSSSSLDAITPTQQNFIPKTTFNYIPTECSRPKDLTETNITTTSATLNWTGYQNSYDLRFRKKPIFFEDFEDGLPSDWTIIDNDGDGYNWFHYSNSVNIHAHSGTHLMESESWRGTALTPDNWLVTPLLQLQGTMKVWLSANNSTYQYEHFAIYLSTSGNSVSDFTSVLVPETVTSSQYVCYSADLSAYAGQQGYIAIRHFNCTDMDRLRMDDFGLFEDPDETGEWVTISNIGSGYTLDALAPGTEYEWQVRGRNCNGGGSYTEWSRAHNFITPFCSPEDQCELTFTLTDSYGDGWNGAYINVVDVETGISLGHMSNQNVAKGEETEIYTLAVCDGRQLRFEWVSGIYDGECSYTVTDINGNVVFSGEGPMSQPFTFTVNCIGVQAQTVALSAGWNWVSFNTEITMDDLKAALLAAYPSPGMNALVVKSKSEGQSAYNPTANIWIGSLSTLDLSQMYMVKVPTANEITVEGLPINPADHPATIAPGVNWIAFPLGQSMSITDAFAGFAMNGDIVKAKTGGQAQWNSAANRWIGALANVALEPGQGYIYKSASSTTRVLSFAQFDYVDLGLPSGLLWATCNVGANAPEEYGDYFAWGETTPKDTYNWDTYQHYNGSDLTKYTGSDGLTTLEPSDDAATANWGEGWRMPTQAEFQELLDNTTVTWTQQNGVNGRLFTAANGNSLFLPAAGYRWGGELNDVGDFGGYWSSSLSTDNPGSAWNFGFYSDVYNVYYDGRSYGQSVRAVRSGL